MRLAIVDLTWASSPDIEPVASRQKQTSIKPNAGIARSLEGTEDLAKIVFFWTDGTPSIDVGRGRGPVDMAGGAPNIAGSAGSERLAGLVGLLLVTLLLVTLTFGAALFLLSSSVFSASAMARVTARVLMILFSLVLSRNFSPSAMHLSMDRVRVTLLL